MRWLLCLMLAILMLAGCGKKEEEVTTTDGQNITNTPTPPPPIAYEVGKGYPKFEDVGKGRQVELNIYVQPGCTPETIRNLLEYIEVYKYRDYNTLIVNMYDNQEAADRPGLDATMVRATMRVTRPRKPVITIIGGEIPEDTILTGAVITQDTATVYLGEKGRLFSSKDQAAWLIKLMKEQPGHAFYEITWLAVGKVKLTYSLGQKLLVRDTEGVCRETWAGMTIENLQSAAKGGGYRGRDFPNTSYTRVPYGADEGKKEEKKDKPDEKPTPPVNGSTK